MESRISDLNRIFGERANYFQYLQKILSKPGRLEVWWKKFEFSLDYRRITIPGLPIYPTPILLLTGWGSGWEGIVPLGVSLAFEGFEVYFISLPGYGSSDNVTLKYYTRNFLCNSAQCLRWVFDELEIEKAHLVGHSMGAEILAKFARERPERSSTLVLLNPSGIYPYRGIYSKINLAWRFILSGMKLRREYQKDVEASGEQYYLQPMIDWCGKQKSAWRPGRLLQRYFEFQSICQGTLPKNLRRVRLPIAYISGSRDTVFPTEETLAILKQNVSYAPSFETMIIEGNHHNPTLFHSEITAITIAQWLKG